MPDESRYRHYRINRSGRSALREFIEAGLIEAGCSIIAASPSDEAPFRYSFATPWGERMGIVAYAFTANSRVTRNRPDDEHRFQVKYGSKNDDLHQLWQDPFGLYTTLFLGINPDLGFFVGADPVLNSPTRFYISKEFKQQNVDEVLRSGWYAWERDQRGSREEPVEVLVGGTRDQFLRYVLFEREVRGEDQGHRQLVAERFSGMTDTTTAFGLVPRAVNAVPTGTALHVLEREFELRSDEILEVISRAPRLKMAVRGWVAERHLEAVLRETPGVVAVRTPTGDGQPDFEVRVQGGRRVIRVECKNVLRSTDALGHPRLDFMRTRASVKDPCSRYYSPHDFDIVAACLHANTEAWEFAGRLTSNIPAHRSCEGKLQARLVIDDHWTRDLGELLNLAAA